LFRITEGESPYVKVCADEALQCPILLFKGYGGHRIEGIGDKHVPWILNLRNVDVVVAVDDERAICLMRLYNEPEGKQLLIEKGVDRQEVDRLEVFGLYSLVNTIGVTKLGPYFEMNERDVSLLLLRIRWNFNNRGRRKREIDTVSILMKKR
jgi:hypothetical protein